MDLEEEVGMNAWGEVFGSRKRIKTHYQILPDQDCLLICSPTSRFEYFSLGKKYSIPVMRGGKAPILYFEW